MRTEAEKLQWHVERSTIFLTHDQGEATTLGQYRRHARRQNPADRLPDDSYNESETRFVTEFIGSVSTNSFPSTVRRRATPVSDSRFSSPGAGCNCQFRTTRNTVSSAASAAIPASTRNSTVGEKYVRIVPVIAAPSAPTPKTPR